MCLMKSYDVNGDGNRLDWQDIVLCCKYNVMLSLKSYGVGHEREI